MTKRALCIGINDYPGTGSDLAGCVNDAKLWEGVLMERGFNVTRLLDKEATRAAMTAAIRDLVVGARSGDSVVLTYSGHGTWVPDTSGDEDDGRDEALCPWDLRTNGPLVDDELHDLFSQRQPNVRLVFVSDSCHSGTVSRMAPAPADARVARVRFLPPQAFMKAEDLRAAERFAVTTPRSRRRSSALLLAGCQDTEYSYDAWFGDTAQGAFTYNAVQALAGLASGATYRDWFRKVRDRLPSSQYPQRPNLAGTRSQIDWPVLA